MSEADEMDAILRHLRRELGKGDAVPAERSAAPADNAAVETCLRDIRSVCGSRRDRHRFLGDLFAPVLIGVAVCAAILLTT